MAAYLRRLTSDATSPADAQFVPFVPRPPDKVNDPIPFAYSLQTCVMLFTDMRRSCFLPVFWFAVWFGGSVNASLGDRLPEFKECVAECITTNCGSNALPIPLVHRLLLWTCPQECDYSCQHIITDQRIARDPPYLQPVLQFHGKWPFYRFLGIQEPFSVLFSLMNFLAHQWGLTQVKSQLPDTYGLKKYYVLFGYLGLASWTFSMIFHTRDFGLTEKLDYFAAGASVLYGLYYAVVRIFHLETPPTTARQASSQHLRSATGDWQSASGQRYRATLLRIWTVVCLGAYLAHVGLLSFVRFDYTYNMAANVVVGVLQNLLWTSYSIYRYQKTSTTGSAKKGNGWMLWPAAIVWFIAVAMGLELFDFPPWLGMLDAHSLWHLGTVGPVIWWYRFLVRDAQDELQKVRLKA